MHCGGSSRARGWRQGHGEGAYSSWSRAVMWRILRGDASPRLRRKMKMREDHEELSCTWERRSLTTLFFFVIATVTFNLCNLQWQLI